MKQCSISISLFALVLMLYVTRSPADQSFEAASYENWPEVQVDSPSEQIYVNGDKVKKEVSFLVSLQSPMHGGHFCSGAIVSNKHFVTSAHCLAMGNSSDITVVSDTLSHTTGGDRDRIVAYHVHSQYSPVRDTFDIAVAKVSSGFKSKAKISLRTRKVGSSDVATVYGWGSMLTTIDKIPDQLEMLEEQILSNEDCDKYKDVTIHESHLCAMSNDCKGYCVGDAGGPLVIQKGRRRELVGIGTMALGGCARFKPDIFSSVPELADFINDAMRNRIP